MVGADHHGHVGTGRKSRDGGVHRGRVVNPDRLADLPGFRLIAAREHDDTLGEGVGCVRHHTDLVPVIFQSSGVSVGEPGFGATGAVEDGDPDLGGFGVLRLGRVAAFAVAGVATVRAEQAGRSPGGSRAEDQHRRDDRDDPAAAAEAIPEGRLDQPGPLHAPLLAVGQHPELGRALFGDDLADLANLGIPLWCTAGPFAQTADVPGLGEDEESEHANRQQGDEPGVGAYGLDYVGQLISTFLDVRA